MKDINEVNEAGKKLANEHWDNYVGRMLEAMGIDDSIINACEFHYKSAFVHGYKHAHEDQQAKG